MNNNKKETLPNSAGVLDLEYSKEIEQPAAKVDMRVKVHCKRCGWGVGVDFDATLYMWEAIIKHVAGSLDISEKALLNFTGRRPTAGVTRGRACLVRLLLRNTREISARHWMLLHGMSARSFTHYVGQPLDETASAVASIPLSFIHVLE